MDITALLGREGLDFLFAGDSSSPYPVAPHRERKDSFTFNGHLYG